MWTDLVVGAAIVRDGRVLAARRSAPPALAGGWEFPGGKVEPGEPDAEALVRECREELGALIEVHGLVGTTAINDRMQLRVYAAELVSGEPSARQDHDMVRWLDAAELDSVPWLDVDRVLLPSIRDELTAADRPRRPSR
jgi:8-oxo-dGTP diphosphatase